MKLDVGDSPRKRSVDERNLLVDEYRTYAERLVRILMKRMALPEELHDELRSAAYLGLIDAADRFDRNGDSTFRTYAFYRIRGAVIDSIRHSTGVRRRRYRLAKVLQSAESLKESSFHGYGGVTPKPQDDNEELVALLDFASKALLVQKLSLSGTPDSALDPADQSPSPEDALGNQEESELLRRYVAELPETERLIIEAYYFRDLSFVEAAEEVVGASKSWVSRVHTRAIQRLYERLTEERST
jgi:RNA polymerase sigma factor for flagellar operon FliA